MKCYKNDEGYGNIASMYYILRSPGRCIIKKELATDSVVNEREKAVNECFQEKENTGE